MNSLDEMLMKGHRIPDPSELAYLKPKTPTVDDLINCGKLFYSEEKDSDGNLMGVAVSLEQVLDYVGTEGIVASMPYIIAGKAKVDKKNFLWQDWFTALSEENAGIDKKGVLGEKGEELVIIVHGGGILNKDRIMQAYSECLTLQNAAKYKKKEFDDLLKGVLPNKKSIELYTIDDVKRGIPEPFGKYGVWMPAETAKSKSSGYHLKTDFMNNELVIARAGTLEYLDAYFEKAKHSKNKNVGNWHRLGGIDFRQPQGRVLFLDNGYYGLSGYYLDNDGRFVGVSPRSGGKGT